MVKIPSDTNQIEKCLKALQATDSKFTQVIEDLNNKFTVRIDGVDKKFGILFSLPTVKIEVKELYPNFNQ